MKHIVLLFLLAFSAGLSAQETAGTLQKFQVGESGCSVYLPASEVNWEKSSSEDSSDVYTGEVSKDNLFYFVIAVKFKDPLTGFASEEMENLLMSYLDYLQEQFGVSESAGYGKGHPVDGYDISAGVIDFWESEDGTLWSVKGQITANNIGIVGVYGDTDPSDNPLTRVVLDGFVFPAGK